MDCSAIIIVVVILIAVAILLYFGFTDTNAPISGGHEVKHNGKTLHIENFKELKRKLKQLYPDWESEQIHNEADRIVAEFLAKMDPSLGYHEQAKYIDDSIAEYIKGLD
jgi:hypothetical protein